MGMTHRPSLKGFIFEGKRYEAVPERSSGGPACLGCQIEDPHDVTICLMKDDARITCGDDDTVYIRASKAGRKAFLVAKTLYRLNGGEKE